MTKEITDVIILPRPENIKPTISADGNIFPVNKTTVLIATDCGLYEANLNQLRDMLEGKRDTVDTFFKGMHWKKE